MDVPGITHQKHIDGEIICHCRGVTAFVPNGQDGTITFSYKELDGCPCISALRREAASCSCQPYTGESAVLQCSGIASPH